MEDLAVFISLNHSVSFRMYFVQLKKKCYLPAKGRSVWWKTVTSGCIFKTSVTVFHIRTSQPANNIYWSSWNFENAIVFKVKIVKMPMVEVTPYNQVFRRNFRFNNLNETSSEIQGASYNQLSLPRKYNMTERDFFIHVGVFFKQGACAENLSMI